MWAAIALFLGVILGAGSVLVGMFVGYALGEKAEKQRHEEDY